MAKTEVMRTGILLFLLLLSLPSLQGAATIRDSGVAEGVRIQYDLTAPMEGFITLTYLFTNTEEVPVFLNHSFEFLVRRGETRVLEIQDTPAGGLEYQVHQEAGMNLLLFHFSRLFTPRERYQVKVVLEGNRLTERSGGDYRFRDVEGNFKEWPIEGFEIFVRLPREGIYRYEPLEIHPGAEIAFEGGRRTLLWKKGILLPGEEFSVLLEFREIPNWPLLVAGALLLLALSFSLAYSRWSGRRRVLMPTEFVRNLPGESQILNRIREMLREAEEEVLITSPWLFYVDWITATVKPLLDRGVRVRIITWPSYERVKIGARGEIRENRKQGFALRRFLSMFPPDTVRLNDNVHSKVWVVDQRQVLVSSANLTQTGLWENYEAGLWVKDGEIARRAAEYFETLWESEETIPLTPETLDPRVASRMVEERKGRKAQQ
jgi:cardiolipin synthase